MTHPSSHPFSDIRFGEFAIPDARLQADFDPRLYPRADGQEAHNVIGSDAIAVRKRAFLSAYYQLNAQYRQLANARETGDEPAAAAALDGLRSACELRDRLERHYAPIGFVAEPVLDGLSASDLRFSYSRLGGPGERTPRSAFIQIDLPEDIRAAAFGDAGNAGS